MMSFNQTTSLDVGLDVWSEDEIFLVSSIATTICLSVIASLCLVFFICSWYMSSLMEPMHNGLVHRDSMEDDALYVDIVTEEEVVYDDIEAEPRPPVPPPRPTSARYFPPHLTVLLSWHRRGFVTTDPSSMPRADAETWLWDGRP
ncbi:uncharacterized protein LOC125036154 isoform X2 [Penaeus chinensis]|uniref:uncharacterized protein LOC125036154 isoform X2 n=1 Tax=Penaeus chinensis TaxID=139456 RepID=UPI001FB5C935|nr:uncharacterized protein LOC125036154 isoform X2 [Penaeus chinensis]